MDLAVDDLKAHLETLWMCSATRLDLFIHELSLEADDRILVNFLNGLKDFEKLVCWLRLPQMQIRRHFYVPSCLDVAGLEEKHGKTWDLFAQTVRLHGGSTVCWRRVGVGVVAQEAKCHLL